MSVKGYFTLTGSLAAITFVVLCFVVFSAVMLYIAIGLGVLLTLAAIAFCVRKWQHSGLSVREARREDRRLEYEHKENLARIQIEQDYKEHLAQLERERLEHDAALERQRLSQEITLQTLQFQLQQHVTLTRLPVDQYGTYLLGHDHEQTPLTHLQPVYKPALLKPGEMPTLPDKIIPARYDLSSVWREFTPSRNEIFLGKSAEGDIVVPGNKLLHCVSTGPTGGGKTNIVRMLLMQLVYIGCETTLMDIHYAPIKEDEGGNLIDWRPIVNLLTQEPIYELGAIVAFMKWLAYTELENRITRQRNGQRIGKPIFFTIAELPAVLDEADKDVAQPLAKILRQGRQYQIFFVGDSQDLLTDTLHMTTGPRECFRTGYYTGGDPTTAKALLDLPKGVTVEEEGLGVDGRVYLKTALHPCTLARVGWASNDSLYTLFNTPAYERLDSPARSYSASGAQTFTGRQQTPPAERTHGGNTERLDARVVEADTPALEEMEDLQPNVQTFTKHGTVQPGEQADMTSGERLEYPRLSDVEITAFAAAYRASGSIDRALSSVGRGSSYRDHARELVRTLGLRKDI